MAKQDKFLERVRNLHALLGSANEGERNSAFARLNELLRREGKTWNDVPGLLAPDAMHDDPDEPAEDGQGHYIPTMLGRDDPHLNPVGLVHEVLQPHVSMKPHELVGAALWIIHTHLYDRFAITPRLALTSPVRGCGKTTMLDIAASLVARPRKADSVTAAAVYRLVDQEHPTLLVDEADNLGLHQHQQGKLRMVFNSGHRCGSSILVGAGQGVRPYATFTPMAIAAIGTLPLPLMERSIVIRMEKSRAPLKRFDLRNPETQRMMNAVYRYLFDWAITAQMTIDLNPAMPRQLRHRVADNWRVLLAIADACGEGECARGAALEFNNGYHDEDAVVILLRDIRDIFNRFGTTFLHSATLVAELNALEDGVIPWSAWRGVRDDQQPRELTSSELARLLLTFQIRPRSIWLRQRREGQNDSSKKGYRRDQFEDVWRRYCPDDGTPAQRYFELRSF